ncbi:ATP-grasp domain-containing protein [Candidatus Bathyarchaeota archaeon]|nr:ATP-grasp domain-containing protein [Candidatus Bathyarchaeota archaeon]
MEKKRVLVFPGGTEIGLEVWRSLKACKDTTLYSAGSAISNHAPYVFRNHFIVPDVYHPDWVDVLAKIIEKHKIDYIFPAHDDVIVALAKNAKKFDAGIISSPLSTCLITRSKRKTYHRFRNLLPTPRIFDTLSDIDCFPVFVKPDTGQGSKDAYRIDNPDTLQTSLRNNTDLIVLENLSGKEYTVDCFTDRKKGLLFCGGRERIRTKSGISMNSKPVDKKINKIFGEYANIISQELEFHGAWFFQTMQDALGVFKLLEIAPRISGTMATHRVLGVNFPLLSIYEKEGYDLEIMTNNYELQIDRALVNRYKHSLQYNKVYVDLDDTLIIKNKVNTQLISFLYQSINRGCKIILITRTSHASNIDCFLRKYRLSEIFDKIICLPKNESKADYIDPEGSIMIDDSFSERKSVFDKLGIPTFDCSMIELLIDERI